MHRRFFPGFLIIAYGAILVKVLILKSVYLKMGSLQLDFSGQASGAPNFIPFKTIVPYLLGESGWVTAIINLIGNVALLVPFGFLVGYFYRKITWLRMFLLAIAVPLIIEEIQVTLSVGIFDIDDVILNALGVLTGYWLFKIFKEWRNSLL